MVPTGSARIELPGLNKRGPISFEVRPKAHGDNSFIYSSYLKSHRKNWPYFWVPHLLYFRPQTEVLTFLLRTASVLVACFPEDPNAILGYIISQPLPDALALHYVYTKLRRIGVGRGLLRAAGGDQKLIVATHMCDDYKVLRTKVAPARMVFDPYLIPRLMAHGSD